MSIPHMTQDEQDRPDLPEYMTWEELATLPDHIARQIELWEGRVVWVRTGTPEHQQFRNRLWSALDRGARKHRATAPEQCWIANSETNVFLDRTHRNDFVTPDFVVYRCLPKEYEYVHFDDVVLVGEVLSPSNTESDIREKKARYADAGISMYWEVALAREPRSIARITISALLRYTEELFPGITPLKPVHYVEIAQWTPADDPDGVHISVPFPIHIPWAELAF
ncbi:Uma2 family endonuclease [Nocardia goodfellowii]|uniref:Uma2 family endonuclease n=1 Tax=Nocardia goodfellowii TaxID=882446 RepID=A0ABS4QRD9_9NOCA|nr:Uma2 family endonuclease [Nocardia goodfellowii]MBP2194281.1 Uma2 family endonuclease [Nocardia goodfellowii]